MIWNPFKIISKSFLGIDIGTSAIKVVELSGRGGKFKLENYGEIAVFNAAERPFRTYERDTLLLSSQDIAQAVAAIVKEARIACKKVVFSIPDFSSFFTNFKLPPMTEEEIPQAIRYEARVHIPLPLSEVTLDWQIIAGKPSEKSPLEILLVSIPNEVISQYQEIASLSGLELNALEGEAFALLRSSVKDKQRVVCMADIGAQSTTISIIDKGILKRSHSFNISGNEFTQRIAKTLNIDYTKAEELKQTYGLSAQNSDKKNSHLLNIREILITLVDLIIMEIEKISEGFNQAEKKEIEKVVLAGGTALVPGLKDYFSETIKKEIEIANPFNTLAYPPILTETLKGMGPAYATAVGAALRGLEQN